MRLEANANYTVLLNPNDVASLVAGKGVTFWITLEDHDDITFKIMKE